MFELELHKDFYGDTIKPTIAKAKYGDVYTLVRFASKCKGFMNSFREQVTAEKIKKHFQSLVEGYVIRLNWLRNCQERQQRRY
jgi:hypothetical protein